LTSNIHSSHDLNRPEAKRFRVKRAKLKIPKIDLVKVFLDLLEAENLKSKDLANEQTDLLAAKEEAVAATKAKSDFFAKMSHEIRTPMNAVLGMTHLALETDLTAKQRDYLTTTKVAEVT
jgi:signal transduction histidine kinase